MMQAEPGDHIRLKGMLVEYRNPGNGFRRGTSVTRTDKGNGACETIYVNAFEIIRKANQGARHFYSAAFWATALSFAGVVLLFFITPFQARRE